MANFTNFAEIALLEWMLAGGSTEIATMPSSGTGDGWWFGLHTTGVDVETADNELSTSVWTNYDRVAIYRSSSHWSTAAAEGGGGYRKGNSSTIDFGTVALSSAVVLGGVSIWDSSSGGNAWICAALTTEKTINNGDPVTFPTTAFGVAFR